MRPASSGSCCCRHAPLVDENNMSLIEQAAKRLEELRRAGVDIPDGGTKPQDTATPTPAPAMSDASAKLQVATPTQARRQRSSIAAAPPPPVQSGPHDTRHADLDLAHIA